MSGEQDLVMWLVGQGRERIMARADWRGETQSIVKDYDLPWEISGTAACT